MAAMTSPPPSPQSLTPLQRLIRSRLDEFGWTAGEVARRAGTRPDGRPRLARATVYRYLDKRIKRSPDADIVAALADGLQLAPATVKEAVDRSLPHARKQHDGDGPAARWRDLYERIGVLPDETQERVLWAVEHLVIGAGTVARSVGVGEDVGQLAEDVYDRIIRTPTERRREMRSALEAEGYGEDDDRQGASDSL